MGESEAVVDVARRIALAATSRGYGAIFGAPQIGCWDPEERRNIEAIEREFEANLSVSITDHPLQTSAFEVFRSELSDPDKTRVRESKIAELILDFVRLDRVEKLVFVVSMDPWMAASLPRMVVTAEELLSRLSEYYSREADPALNHGGDGVFILPSRSDVKRLRD